MRRVPKMVLGLLGVAGSISAQQLQTIIVDPEQGVHYADAEDRSVRALPVRDNVYVIVGAGANVVVQTGENGVLLVDTGSGGESDKVMALLGQLSPFPVGYILNTSFLADHVGGNAAIDTAAEARGGARGRGSRGNSTAIAAHEAVLGRLSAPTGEDAPTPSEAWPSQTYYTAYHDIYFNGEGVQMFHAPNAVTDGDSVVFFRRSDVIAAGDIFLTTRYPTIDPSTGGSIDGVIDGLNRILELAIPEEKQEGGTIVIPGHGRISDEADVLEYRDMLTIIRDRVQAAIDDRMTLEAVRAAGLTREYDPRYGPADMFIDGVYQSLEARR